MTDLIEMYSGTIGSGKSYHALERVVEALRKGKHVIANFPLEFSSNQIQRGYADRFMYLDDRLLMGRSGVSILISLSKRMGWMDDDKEGHCLVVIDEATNYFPRDQAAHPEQKLWRTFFSQSRKMGYDFVLIVQDETSLNKTITACIEYIVRHRKINNIFPFKLLPVTIFMYITIWRQARAKVKTESSIFVRRLARMYNHKMMFAGIDKHVDFGDIDQDIVYPEFGNCRPDGSRRPDGARGRGPFGEGPEGDGRIGAAEETVCVS